MSTSGGIVAAGLTLEGSQTTEATTTSTTAVDMLTVSGLTIAVGAVVWVTAAVSQTANTGINSYAGLTVNSTVVASATRSWDSGDDSAQQAFVNNWFVHGVAGYLRAGYRLAIPIGANIRYEGFDADLPTVEMTQAIFRGRVAGSTTMGADEMHVYTLAI